MEHRATTYSREFIAETLRHWREGEGFLVRQRDRPRRADYECAIAHVLSYLQRYATMPELMAAYFDVDRSRVGDADWLELACRSCAAGRALNRLVVEEVACWRRAQQLVAEPHR